MKKNELEKRVKYLEGALALARETISRGQGILDVMTWDGHAAMLSRISELNNNALTELDTIAKEQGE